MLTIDRSRPGFAATGAIRTAGAAVTRSLVAAFERLAQWQDRARQRRRLQTLDDHLLKDLGLSRLDVDRESSKHFWTP